jgi:flagellar biosynthesis/type III secretory pathway M-ring protein FliF/YscJ
MDILKAQLDRLSEQLKGLSATQKMLAMALVAILAMTLVWWGRYASEPDMVILLDQSLAAPDIAQITSMLDGKQITYRMNGDRILVPTDRKFEILADLNYSNKLPHDMATGFDKMAENISPWDSQNVTDAKFNHAKELTLAQVLSLTPGVASATVMIDQTSESHIDRTVQPSATVNIITRDGHTHSRQLVTAVAALVSGAVAELIPSRVNVVIDGVSYPIPNATDDSLGDADASIDIIRATETMYREKVLSSFAYIQGLMVSVTVDLDTKSTHTEKTSVDVKSSLHAPSETSETSDEKTTVTPGVQESGVASNTAVSLTGTTPGGSVTEIKTTQTEGFLNVPAETHEVIHQAAGTATPVAASIQVPRSFFVNEYKSNNGNKEPDDAALSAYRTARLADIRKTVMSCCDLKSEDAVVASMYTDMLPMAAANPVLLGAPGPAPSAMSAYGKQIGVGALAAVSLLMMMLMVRRSAPGPVVAAAASADTSGVKLRGNVQEVVGEASDGEAVIDAIEMDEEAVKTQQVLRQVGQMVSSNPDAAASLVKRWMNRP